MNDIEDTSADEDASVTAPPTPPSKKPSKPSAIQSSDVSISKYKLDIYAPNGLLKNSINAMLFSQAHKQYGDVIRASHSGKFSTIEEIYARYLTLANALKYETNRSLGEVLGILSALVEFGFIEIRTSKVDKEATID